VGVLPRLSFLWRRMMPQRGEWVAVHAVSRSCWLGFLHFALQKYTFCGEYRQKKG
jgi:hypothetical protein